MKQNPHQSKPLEVLRSVSFYAGQSPIEIAGRKKTPDRSKAYVEFRISKAFPAMTSFRTAILPAVIANSYLTLEDQVFNLGHMMRAYDKENTPRDRILGTIVGVEFPQRPMGGWKAQADPKLAPDIRAVAVIHKNAEGVDRIIGQHQSGRMTWTVSMENEFWLETSGFLINGNKGVEAFEESTPEDLRQLGFVYTSYDAAPTELQDTFDADKAKVKKPFKRQDTVFLLGGINDFMHYKGTGLVPPGYAKEADAEVTQLLASEVALMDVDGELVPNVFEPFRELLRVAEELVEKS